jgi:hypothetical protein
MLDLLNQTAADIVAAAAASDKASNRAPFIYMWAGTIARGTTGKGISKEFALPIQCHFYQDSISAA